MSINEVDIFTGKAARPVNITEKIGGRSILMGYSVKEASGTASAEIDIVNGADATGMIVCPVTLSAGQSTEDWFGPQGLQMDVGVFCHVASGAVVGSVWVHDDWREE